MYIQLHVLRQTWVFLPFSCRLAVEEIETVVGTWDYMGQDCQDSHVKTKRYTLVGLDFWMGNK